MPNFALTDEEVDRIATAIAAKIGSGTKVADKPASGKGGKAATAAAPDKTDAPKTDAPKADNTAVLAKLQEASKAKTREEAVQVLNKYATDLKSLKAEDGPKVIADLDALINAEAAPADDTGGF